MQLGTATDTPCGTTRYVSQHAEGSDEDGTRLRTLRAGVRMELLKRAVTIPLAVAGTVTHAPIAALSVFVGRHMGVTDEGDRSVEATMRVIAASIGVLAMYPMAGAAVWWLSSSVVAATATVGSLGVTGYCAAMYEPLPAAIEIVQARLRLLTHDNEVDSLRRKRARLQTDIRAFADDTVPSPELRGWWRDPEAFNAVIQERQAEYERAAAAANVVVTAADIDAAMMRELSIRLSGPTKRHPDERAVLVYKTAPGNSRALVWIPGRNDSFYHTHVLDRILEAGFDVYAVDLRRCGRARWSETGEELTPELLAHDSYNFYEYFEVTIGLGVWLCGGTSCSRAYVANACRMWL